MSNVVRFTGATLLDLDPAQVLEEAAEYEFKEVIVIGVTADDGFYFASSVAHMPDVMWRLREAEYSLLHPDDA